MTGQGRCRYALGKAAAGLIVMAGLAGSVHNAEAADKALTIGASVPFMNDPAWVRIVDYARYVAKILNVNLIVVDAGGKEDKQIQDVQSLLSRGVQALIFDPVSAANAPAIIRLADRAHTPAIATDRYPGFPADNNEAPYLTFVGPDNVDAGRKIAQFMIDNGVKHFVAIGGLPGDSNNQERSKGMREAIAASADKGVKLLQYVGVLQSEDSGYTTMQNLLAAHPPGTIDGVWCYNDALCVGAYRAIKQAGRDKEIKIGAMDLDPQALDLIKDHTNYIYSIGGHWLMLGFAEMIAYDYLHGHKPLSQFSRIDDLGVNASGFEKFNAEYINSNPPIDIKQVHADVQSERDDANPPAYPEIEIFLQSPMWPLRRPPAREPRSQMSSQITTSNPQTSTPGRLAISLGGKTSDFIGRYIAYTALIVLIIFFGLLAPSLFLTVGNFATILQNSSVQCVVAIGMTFVILIGSIDLSVGSNMALTATIAAMASTQIGGAAFFLTPFIGGLIGLVNALVFVYGRIPSFVVTLGMLSIARGLTLIITNGAPIPIPFSGLFSDIGIPPVPILIVIGLALVASFVLLKTSFGRYTFAIGGDEDKANVLGLPVKKVKIIVFTLSGALAGLGGGILAAEIGSGSPTMGTGFELTAISAVVIGGTSLTGGRGSILGTVVGSLVMSTLANGLIILGISTEVQTVLTGIVLVGAVLLSIQRGKIKVMK